MDKFFRNQDIKLCTYVIMGQESQQDEDLKKFKYLSMETKF